MKNVVLIVRNWALVFAILVIYLASVWLLVEKIGLNLLVSNAFAFSLAFSLSLLAYRHWIVNSTKNTLQFILPFTSAALFSLAINEYFVYFFYEHGRLDYLLAITFATIVSSVFFVAFNLFFGSND